MQSFMGITSTVSSPLPSSPPASATESRVSTIVIIPGKKKIHIFLPSLFQAMILTSKFSWESIKELFFFKIPMSTFLVFYKNVNPARACRCVSLRYNLASHDMSCTHGTEDDLEVTKYSKGYRMRISFAT